MSALFDTRSWIAITETAAVMTELIDDALPPGGALADVEGLHGRLLAALEVLGNQLPSEDREHRVALLAPIAMLYDERILGRLAIMSVGSALDWPSLQTALDTTRFGGDLFFRRVERLLAPGELFDPLVAQVYLWCLESGFLGRHAEEPQALDEYRARLWEVLEQPELPTEAPIASEVARFPGLPRTRTIVFVVLGMAVVWQLLLVVGMRTVTA